MRAGGVQLLTRNIDHPNGVAFSPDEKYLYVTNTLLKNVLRFDVDRRGVKQGLIFIDMSGDKRACGPDGIRVDSNGNVYSTGPGGVWIMSPAGKHIGTISTPLPLTNLTFGGGDLKTLYMTGIGALYRIHLRASGARSWAGHLGAAARPPKRRKAIVLDRRGGAARADVGRRQPLISGHKRRLSAPALDAPAS